MKIFRTLFWRVRIFFFFFSCIIHNLIVSLHSVYQTNFQNACCFSPTYLPPALPGTPLQRLYSRALSKA